MSDFFSQPRDPVSEAESLRLYLFLELCPDEVFSYSIPLQECITVSY